MSVNEVTKAPPPPSLVILGATTLTSQTFAVGDEDHTLGNTLRHTLMNSLSDVEFAGYSVPHPSEAVLQMRIQHSPGSQQPVTESLKESCRTLASMCDHVKSIVMEKTPVPDNNGANEVIKIE